MGRTPVFLCLLVFIVLATAKEYILEDLIAEEDNPEDNRRVIHNIGTFYIVSKVYSYSVIMILEFRYVISNINRKEYNKLVNCKNRHTSVICLLLYILLKVKNLNSDPYLKQIFPSPHTT